MRLVLAVAQSASVAGDVGRNVARHVEFARVASAHGAELLVFPELSLIGYELDLARTSVVDADALRPLREFALQTRMTLVVGAPIWGDSGSLHIGAFVLGPDGTVGTYTKAHVHESEQHVFTSGPGGALLQVDGVKVALAICADATFPSHAAGAAECGADVYAVGAMIDEAGYARKSALLERYAREHRMAVALANYSGVTGGEVSAGGSAIWDAEGRIVVRSSGVEEALVIARKDDAGWSGWVVPAPGAAALPVGV